MFGVAAGELGRKLEERRGPSGLAVEIEIDADKEQKVGIVRTLFGGRGQRFKMLALGRRVVSVEVIQREARLGPFRVDAPARA